MESVPDLSHGNTPVFPKGSVGLKFPSLKNVHVSYISIFLYIVSRLCIMLQYPIIDPHLEFSRNAPLEYYYPGTEII